MSKMRRKKPTTAVITIEPEMNLVSDIDINARDVRGTLSAAYGGAIWLYRDSAAVDQTRGGCECT